jgi:hypothetical protein
MHPPERPITPVAAIVAVAHEMAAEVADDVADADVTAQKGTKIFRDNGGRFLVVSKELCYGKAETLEDAEKAAKR